MMKRQICISILVLNAIAGNCFAQAGKQGQKTTQKKIKTETIESKGAALKRFVGTWKLILLEIESPDGEFSFPMGQDATGLLMYDSNGNMSLQVMRRDRPKISLTEPNITLDEVKALASGYTALYGTYDVNEADKIITYHVQASLSTVLIGMDLVLSFEFSDNKLVVKTPPSKTGEPSSRLYAFYERVK